ncbi:hypothetical protein [Natronomonas salsuginis]|uniref:Uncharacterized protein n=1 Tax=Natronomonas salsuginis TaxID=2217661 RepID=A0A4U5JEP0_9EURY|nr:hypothetical protein [Natronomonas salsuginis]TKR26147.1 hypothetical protein DM868_06540 [Natronomonas salsuginis]
MNHLGVKPRGTRPAPSVEDEHEQRELQGDGERIGGQGEGERSEEVVGGGRELRDADLVGEAEDLDRKLVGEVVEQFDGRAAALEQREGDREQEKNYDEEGSDRDRRARESPWDTMSDESLSERIEHVRDRDCEKDDLDDVPEDRDRQRPDGDQESGDDMTAPSERGHTSRCLPEHKLVPGKTNADGATSATGILTYHRV